MHPDFIDPLHHNPNYDLFPHSSNKHYQFSPQETITPHDILNYLPLFLFIPNIFPFLPTIFFNSSFALLDAPFNVNFIFALSYCFIIFMLDDGIIIVFRVFILTCFAIVRFLDELCITYSADSFIEIGLNSNHSAAQIYLFENVDPDNCNIKQDVAT